MPPGRRRINSRRSRVRTHDQVPLAAAALHGIALGRLKVAFMTVAFGKLRSKSM
jgi:hypothetical protein